MEYEQVAHFAATYGLIYLMVLFVFLLADHYLQMIVL